MAFSPRQFARLALGLSLVALSACKHSAILQYEMDLVEGIAGGFSCNPPGLLAVGAIVRKDQGLLCSGTLITEDTLLTAAHCLEGEDLASLSFVIGEDLRSAVRYPIASGVSHPQYQGSKHGSYDIALLRLREPVPGVTPLPYRRSSLPVWFSGQLTFAGYGDDNGAAKTGSGIKRCLRLYIGRVNDFTFENDTPEHDICYGDSGGPALEYYAKDKWRIVGIIASGDSQCKRFGLSARVDVAAEWIDKTVSPLRVATGSPSPSPETGLGGEEEEVNALMRADYERRVAALESKYMLAGAFLVSPGALVARVSAQSGRMRGIAGGLTVDAVTPGIARQGLGSLSVVASAEVLAGSVLSEEGRSSFLFLMSLPVGLGLHLGSPKGWVLRTTYYCPGLMVMHGRVRVPLIGLGASVGYQTPQASISLVYQYSMTHILHPDEPNVHLLGLSLTFPMLYRAWPG